MALINDLLDVQIPKHVRISPNGQSVIYATSTISRTKYTDRSLSTIWLAQVGHEKSARQITSGEYNDNDPEWSPDSESVAFVSDRGQPGETSAIYTLPITAGGEPYALTAPDNKRAIEGFNWSPDGEFIAYTSADEKSPELKQREKDKDDVNVWGENLVLSRLRLVHVKTKEVTTLTEGTVNITGQAWSPDGTRIAFLHTEKPDIESRFVYGYSISVIDVSTKTIRAVQHFASVMDSPKWVGSTLFFTGNVNPAFLSASECLWSIDLELDNPVFERRAHGDDTCVGGFVQASQNHIVIGAKQGVNGHLHTLDGKILQAYKTDIPSFDAKLSPNSENIILAVIKSSIDVPIEVYSTTSSSNTHTQLSSHGSTLNHYHFGTSTVLECQSSDNLVSLDAIYLSPTNPRTSSTPNGPFPTAVICHGGPYNRSTNVFAMQSPSWPIVLLAAGYGVLMPNYRGSSGRGDAFAAWSREDIGTVDYDDVITLTQHAIEQGFADKDRLLLGGWSNGGAIAYLASVRNGLHGLGWRYRAIVAGAGTSDADTLRFTSDMGMTLELGLRGVAPWDSEVGRLRTRERASAIWGVKAAVERGGVVPPMLILHCEGDKRVPFEQAVGFRRALLWHGLPFEFVSYPREGHKLLEYMHVRDRMERVLRWVERYISPS